MLRWRGLKTSRRLVAIAVTIGVFDGVHRGHAQLINSATAAAKDRGIPVGADDVEPAPHRGGVARAHPAATDHLTRRAEWQKSSAST